MTAVGLAASAFVAFERPRLEATVAALVATALTTEKCEHDVRSSDKSSAPKRRQDGLASRTKSSMPKDAS